MSLARRSVSLTALACCFAACSHATAPAAASATVTVRTQTLAVTTISAGAVTWIVFTVPLRIDNTGSRPLTFEYCASRIEARAGDTWSVAWTPICTAGSAAPVVIPGGEGRDVTVGVQAAIEGPGGPPWRGGAAANSYRFSAGLMPVGAGAVIPIVPSNAFTLSGRAQERDPR